MSDLKARIAAAQGKLDSNPLPMSGGKIHLSEKGMTNVTIDNNETKKLHPLVKATCIVVLVFIGLWLAGSVLQGILIAQALT